jgi:hypothetical protein
MSNKRFYFWVISFMAMIFGSQFFKVEKKPVRKYECDPYGALVLVRVK